MSIKNVDGFDMMLINKESKIGCVLEVDLECPDELHALHNDYPLAPEKFPVSNDMLANYYKNPAEKYEIKVGNVKKLVSNLGNKTNYELGFRSLQFYLSLGMKLTRIHRVLKFKQSDWMKKYIGFNTGKRKNAANSSEKDSFKLIVNSVYGKTMENLQKRINVRTINNEKCFLKCTSKPIYITHKILNKNYAAIHEVKPVLKLNKSIYVGFTVLELSKWLMYDFHYNFLTKIFDAELLFTETDSLVYEIKSEDVYEEFFKHKHLFDFNNFPKN